ncbi:hypothetical protein NV379_02870 [Paenibacillus sp. N1-5-1-14]|uniref:hypothetical protein n=1 Tax=Paenibacillus radicibacter TaxID=2972488 RepID=UPI002158DFE6|nr:hypothetical protein [Paenibacillus radicibacter]MCR8641590.1 hypothetical protein [Paenibacillus radicibacter]
MKHAMIRIMTIVLIIGVLLVGCSQAQARPSKQTNIEVSPSHVSRFSYRNLLNTHNIYKQMDNIFFLMKSSKKMNGFMRWTRPNSNTFKDKIKGSLKNFYHKKRKGSSKRITLEA